MATAAGRPDRMRSGNPNNFLTRPEVIGGYASFFTEQTGVESKT